MSPAGSRPPLPIILKTASNFFRHPPICRRCLATQSHAGYTPSTQNSSLFPTSKNTKTPYGILNEKHPLRRQIKAIPSPPSTAKKYPFPQQEWQDIHLASLDPNGLRTRLFAKDNPDSPKPGDILLCTFKTGEPFSGVCLSIRRRGVDTAILLRNRLLMTGVEMYVKIYSPNVKSIEIVKRAEKRARRARLYYMRQPKHDRGSVEGVVEDYLRRRRLIRSGAVGVQNQTRGKKNSLGKAGVGAR